MSEPKRIAGIRPSLWIMLGMTLGMLGLYRFKRPHTEIAEWYWLTEYLDYSNKPFKV